MGEMRPPLRVKLITGVIYNDSLELGRLVKELEMSWGETDTISEPYRFDFTDYYNKEMGGGPLTKKFFSFRELIDIDGLSEIKHNSNSIEMKFGGIGTRNCNIDPGYLSLSKFVLASTKDFYHRIYIGKNIYAELTMYFRDEKFLFLPWTYPDFKSGVYDDYFLRTRAAYKKQLKTNNNRSSIWKEI